MRWIKAVGVGLVAATTILTWGVTADAGPRPSGTAGTALSDAGAAGTTSAAGLVPGPKDAWKYLAGSTLRSDGLRITGLGRKITQLDGTGGDAHPPVNLGGSHLAVSGDVRITAALTRPAGVTATLSLLGRVPVVYDEWRQHRQELDLTVSDRTLRVTAWTDASSRARVDRTVTVSPGTASNVIVERKGRTITVWMGSATVSFADPGVFPDGTVHLGADAAPVGASWTLTDLTAQGIGGGHANAVGPPSLKVGERPADGLRAVAASATRRLPIGAAMSPAPLLADAGYRALAVGQFSMLTDHVGTVARHYAGRVAEWDVVNEPLSDEDEDYATRAGLRQHLWAKAMGESYIGDAFRAARAADPAAKLYLNDYGLEQDGERWDALLALSSRVSEIDVHGENATVQARQYEAVLTACLKEPTCSSYTSWGITDRYGSTASDRSYPLEPGDELLWDTRLRPKPAVATLRKVLAGGK